MSCRHPGSSVLTLLKPVLVSLLAPSLLPVPPSPFPRLTSFRRAARSVFSPPHQSISRLHSWNMGYDISSSASNASALAPHSFWNVCESCRGEGRIRRPPSRKAQMRHKRARPDSDMNQTEQQQSEMNNTPDSKPKPLVARYEPCRTCQSSGVVASLHSQPVNPKLTSVAIIGGGLAGLAFATACRHRGIPHVVFERDARFSQRAQGYGLTMQQASKALKGFGIKQQLVDGITSTKHVVHNVDGTVVGQWGLRHWEEEKKKNPTTDDNDDDNGRLKKEPRRQNFHIARQALRFRLLQSATAHEELLEDGASNDSSKNDSVVKWNHRLVEYRAVGNQVELTFDVGGSDNDQLSLSHTVVRHVADLVVGADGIRSQVRRQLVGEERTPLRYLDCFVMLGICTLSADIKDKCPSLLDGETVFQTADGTTRIYMMPYSVTEYMWQLSFPMPSEQDAILLSQRGPQTLKEEALRRCQTWHAPVPEILAATPVTLISGYPVYDRELLSKEHLDGLSSGANEDEDDDSKPRGRHVTLMGDAAHPMSPFKGQGANQALLDALALARAIYQAATEKKGKAAATDGDGNNKSALVQSALQQYEGEMMARSAGKVKGSAEASRFLHTKIAIQKGNITRGAAASRQGNNNNGGG